MRGNNAEHKLVALEIYFEDDVETAFDIEELSHVEINDIHKEYFTEKTGNYFYATNNVELHICKEAGEDDLRRFDQFTRQKNITIVTPVYDDGEGENIAIFHRDISTNKQEEFKLQTVAEKQDGTLCIRIWPEGTDDSVMREWISIIENEEIC